MSRLFSRARASASARVSSSFPSRMRFSILGVFSRVSRGIGFY